MIFEVFIGFPFVYFVSCLCITSCVVLEFCKIYFILRSGWRRVCTHLHNTTWLFIYKWYMSMLYWEYRGVSLVVHLCILCMTLVLWCDIVLQLYALALWLTKLLHSYIQFTMLIYLLDWLCMRFNLGRRCVYSVYHPFISYLIWLCFCEMHLLLRSG